MSKSLITESIQKIIDALHEAGTADTVFLALNHVPTENLKDMKKMILYILNHRKKEHGELN